MVTVRQHLANRHLDLDLHRPIIDEVDYTAVFLLWNLSGQIVGYQQYRPHASKERKNDPREGRYFTYRKQPTIAVWGVESLKLTSDIIFVAEGIFDAARLTRRGVAAIAVLSNDPTQDVRNWLYCLGKKIVVVYDNDKAGKRLQSCSKYQVTTGEKDLGDADEEEVDKILKIAATL